MRSRELCGLLRHRPLSLGGTKFPDAITGLAVRRAVCPCGLVWLTDGGRWIGFKMEAERGDAE